MPTATPARNILITSALPYANGSLHLGHMVEYIQTDIWARFQRMRGNDCRYVCADDAHGTPIMLRAERDGITPEALIDAMNAEHQTDFAAFQIGFDHYHSTHSEENRQLANRIYQRLRDGGHIHAKTIRQAYDPEKSMFLPDRFVKGECPRCGAPDQYGDSCEACGATYSPTELKNPRSAVSGATPIEKESEHLFFKLGDFETLLRDWHASGHVQAEVANKLKEWFDTGLADWDISRDSPYFGFEIPDQAGKYFYVWLDAPIGYMASFKALCDQQGLDFDRYWGADSDAELYHFIGKDIVYFHALFWPAMLHGAGYRKPNGVFAHGFLTVNGKKMSKSRGTFITARAYLDQLKPDYLRYYFAAKLNNGVEDIDLNLEDFRLRVNSDLVGKVINIASRCAGFINKRFDGQILLDPAEASHYQPFADAAEPIAQAYENRDYGNAMRQIMALADIANQYIDEHKPWVLAKQDDQMARVQAVCSQGLNDFRALIGYLKPVLPEIAAASEHFLNIPPLSWEQLSQPLDQHKIQAFKPLLQRVEQTQIDALIAASDTPTEQTTTAPTQGPLANDPISEQIEFPDFAKLDLRIAKIAHAEHVKGADKLLKLQLDLGGESRQVFAGIKSAYSPEQLQGRLTLMVANLKPRKMRFGLSEGMVLAAGGDAGLYLLSPDSGAEPGMRVK